MPKQACTKRKNLAFCPAVAENSGSALVRKRGLSGAFGAGTTIPRVPRAVAAAAAAAAETKMAGSKFGRRRRVGPRGTRAVRG